VFDDGAPLMWGVGPAFRAILVGGGDGAIAQAVTLAGGLVVAELAWGEPIVTDPNAILVLDATGENWAGLGEELATFAVLADVVCCSFDQLDVVADTVLLTDAQLLCEPSTADAVAALTMAAAAVASPDGVREGEGARLRRFSGEVARLAAVLARLAAAEEAGDVADRRPLYDPGFDRGQAVASDPPVDARAVRQLLRARRLRDGFFGAGLFEDPAWDMLLDLFAAELEGAEVSVSSLCIAAAVAPTTALRWVGRMTDAGLFDRRPDPQDRRRAFVGLSARGSAAMRGYFGAVRMTFA
jgi:hypothetical protein